MAPVWRAQGAAVWMNALLPRVERFEIQSVTRKLNNVIRGLDTCIVEAVRA
jgi:hypothetical protein